MYTSTDAVTAITKRTDDKKIISGKKNMDQDDPSHNRFLITNKFQTEQFETFPRKRQDFLPGAIAAIEQTQQIKCTILVPGDSDRKPGDMIKLDMPEHGATDDIIDKVNRFFKGLWLVTDVRHVINRTDAYRTAITIIKNSFPEKIEELKPVGEYEI